VRGDRSARGHVERSTCTRRTVGGGKHPGPQRAVLLLGRAVIRGSRSVAAFGREGSPGLALSAPVTNGCTRGAEEGISRNIQGARNLRSVPRPTVLGPPVAGTARCRRGGWLGFISGLQSPHGKKQTRGGSTKARGSRSVGLVPREGRVTTVTKREEGCGPRRAAKTKARECARTSLLQVAEVDRRSLSASQKLLHRSKGRASRKAGGE